MTLTIGNLQVSIPLALAPMVGLSHSALRSLVLGVGGVGLLYTEMLSARRLPSEDELSPFLVRDVCENPLIYQIFVTEESEIEPAVERLTALNAQGIDINLGCPAPRLRKIGAGLHLAKKPETANAIIKRLRKSTSLPISVKIRLGESEDEQKLLRTCLSYQDMGVDLITIHARLDEEKFCRKPRWKILHKVTSTLSIPVLANGGISSVEDAGRCLEQSGASGLMIGRAGVRCPWLFREIATELFGLKRADNCEDGPELYFLFVRLLKKRFAPERRLGRLKQFTHHFAANYAFGHNFASRVQNSSSISQALSIAYDFFKKAA